MSQPDQTPSAARRHFWPRRWTLLRWRIHDALLPHIGYYLDEFGETRWHHRLARILWRVTAP